MNKIFYFILLLLPSCTFNAERSLWQETLERNSFEAYYQFSLKHKESKYLHAAYDSLSSHFNHDRIALAFYHQVMQKQVLPADQFSLEIIGPYDNLGKITSNNVFEIYISENNEVSYDGANSISDDSQTVIKYFLTNLAEKRTKSIHQLGKREVSKGIIWISVELNQIKQGQTTSWQKLFEIYWNVHDLIKDMRSEAAINEYDESFENLQKEEQLAITELVPLVCVFEFKSLK